MRPRRGSGTLGTFGGVFTPSILTILGIILFLRLGFVVGNAGLGRALLILALATSISALTSTSLSAIATNRKVRGGGDYYLISRSLGIAYGGALGLTLFAAQAISVAFYAVGFGEALAAMSPADSGLSTRGIAAIVTVVLLALAYIGANLATRFQYVVMTVLFAAIIAFFIGGVSLWSPSLLAENWERPTAGLGFWPLFAIFFPAVTGFTQGVSMSGDLKTPERSLAVGTFSAVGISTLIYVAAIFVFAASLPETELVGNYNSMKLVASPTWMVDAGVLAATFSSALASFLAAPRILQALASDRVFTSLFFLAKTHGPSRNPRRAVLLTAVIAFATIALGNLNAIAAVVSMFFLITYALLNYATYIEATAASPSFRPRFRFFHRRTSLAATVLCGGAMLAINPMSGVIAIALVAAVHQYVTRTAVPSRWRDSRRAYRFRRVKEGLREIAREPDSARDWQPHILTFTESADRREQVLRFASWIAGGSGVTTAVHIVEGEGTLESIQERRKEAEEALRVQLEEDRLDAFPLAIAAPDLRIAAATLVQAWGVGPIHANTVLLNWVEHLRDWTVTTAPLWYTMLLRSAIQLQQNVVVLNADDAAWRRVMMCEPEDRRIDVWWWEDESCRLALLFAYLMTRTEAWDEANIRLLIPTRPKTDKSVEGNLAHRLEDMRIEATIETVVNADTAALVEQSEGAGVVFLPLRIEGMRVVNPFGQSIDALLAELPVAALVAAAQDVPLGDEKEGHVVADKDATPPIPDPPSDKSDAG